MSSTAPIVAAPAALKKDFDDLVALFDSLSEASNQLNSLNAQLNVDHLANVRLHTDLYKELQSKVGEIDAAIQVIAARNPQWFAKKATLETPYGQVKRTPSTKVVVADEQVSITLIKAAGRGDDFLATTTTIRKEVIELLEDDELKKYGIRRETTYNFNAKPAGVDLGKSVAAAEKTDKGAAKTVKKVGAS